MGLFTIKNEIISTYVPSKELECENMNINQITETIYGYDEVDVKPKCLNQKEVLKYLKWSLNLKKVI